MPAIFVSLGEQKVRSDDRLCFVLRKLGGRRGASGRGCHSDRRGGVAIVAWSAAALLARGCACTTSSSSVHCCAAESAQTMHACLNARRCAVATGVHSSAGSVSVRGLARTGIEWRSVAVSGWDMVLQHNDLSLSSHPFLLSHHRRWRFPMFTRWMTDDTTAAVSPEFRNTDTPATSAPLRQLLSHTRRRLTPQTPTRPDQTPTRPHQTPPDSYQTPPESTKLHQTSTNPHQTLPDPISPHQTFANGYPLHAQSYRMLTDTHFVTPFHLYSTPAHPTGSSPGAVAKS